MDDRFPEALRTDTTPWRGLVHRALADPCGLSHLETFTYKPIRLTCASRCGASLDAALESTF